MRHNTHPAKQERPDDLRLRIQPLSAPSSAAACGAVSGSHSDWAQPGSLPGLQLEKLKGAPAPEVSWDQRKPLQPISSPSCCFWPHSPPASLSSAVAFTEGSFPRWCHSNRHNTCPLAAGLINGLSARASTQGEVCQTPTSPLLFWGLATKTGSRPLH